MLPKNGYSKKTKLIIPLISIHNKYTALTSGIKKYSDFSFMLLKTKAIKGGSRYKKYVERISQIS